MSEQAPTSHSHQTKTLETGSFVPYGTYPLEAQEKYVKNVLEQEPAKVSGIDLSKQLEFVRIDLDFIPSHEAISDYFEGYFNNLPDLPEFISNAKKASEEKTNTQHSWAEWLSKHTDDQQLLNFLDWHHYNFRRQLAGPESIAALEAMEQEYVAAIDGLRASGVLHPETADTHEEIEEISFKLNDIFGPLMLGGALGTAYPETRTVEMTEGYKRATLWHELNHLTIGKAGMHDETNGHDAEWLDEALTEHLTQAAISGEVEIVDPSDRTQVEEHPIYKTDRKLLQKLLTGGSKPIDVRLFTLAYSARSPEAREAAFAVLEDALDEAHDCPNTLGKIKEYIDSRSITVEEGGFGPIKLVDPEACEQALKDLVEDLNLALST